MPGYVGFKRKKNRLGMTLAIVGALHVVIGGGLVWLASTSVGQQFIEIYKVKIRGVQEKEPEASKPPAVKPPEPEPPAVKPPEPEAPAAAPEAQPVEPESESAEAPSQEEGSAAPEAAAPESAPSTEVGQGIRLPASGNPFASSGTPGRKFSGYVDLVTSEIQRVYHQPPDLADRISLAVWLQLRLDEQGKLLGYQLMRSSGNEKFDQSALSAIAQLKQLRPPPSGMSHTIVVKFIPPS